jgi:hypothetical protein
MDPKLKKILRGLSLEIRRLLEGRHDEQGQWLAGDLEKRLNGMGVWRDREPKPADELPHLSVEDKAARRLVDGYLKLREEAGVSRSDAVGEFVREAAYTWANRLFALRCMEARGIIDEVVLQKDAYGGRSLVHHRFAQKNPGACVGDDDGLYAALFAEFAERSKELPSLFNPGSAAVALRPSVGALKRTIALLSGRETAHGHEPASDEVFVAPDALGWVYQYYQDDEKKRIDHSLRARAGFKCEGADIVPKTALYTESYMVKFLVQNSLGALWMGMYPDSRLFERWDYYVKYADHAPAARKPVRNLTFLDPAQGSGHFLLEAFDLLYVMYEEEAMRLELEGSPNAVTPKQICAAILNRNLYGIDIDGCSVQIAAAALWMRAKEKAQNLEADDLNSFHEHLVATNIRLPTGGDHLKVFLQRHREDDLLRPALELVFQGLEHADELGALLQIEEPVNDVLRRLKQDADKIKGMRVQAGLFEPTLTQGTLPVGVEDYDKWKCDALKRLQAHFEAEARTADSAQAFFGESAGRGIAFLNLLFARYDVVAANPPYLGSQAMGPVTKNYIQLHFPSAKRDMYLAFILRCVALSRGGRVALVAQQAWLFMKQIGRLRERVLESCAIEAVGHLGPGAFHEISGAHVNVALFVAAGLPPPKEHRLTAIKVTSAEGPDAKAEALRIGCSQEKSPSRYRVRQLDLRSLPSQSVVYWCGDRFLQLLRSSETIDGCGYVGYTASANGRFVRCFWEVPGGSRWLLYSKGGGFGRWYGLQTYCVDWDRGGTRPSAYVRDHYAPDKFTLWVKSGPTTSNVIVWSEIGSGSLGARLMGEGVVVSRTGPGVFLDNQGDLPGLLAYMNSRAFTYLMRLLCCGLHFAYPYVAKAHSPTGAYAELGMLGDECRKIKAMLVSDDITDVAFVSRVAENASEIDRTLALAAVLHTLEGIIEGKVAIFCSFSEEDCAGIRQDTGQPPGQNPMVVGYDRLDGLPWQRLVPTDGLMKSSGIAAKAATDTDLLEIRRTLKAMFLSGSSAIERPPEQEADLDEASEEEDDGLLTNSPIPAQTFLEELARDLALHPVSVYWLLKEGIEGEGWRCLHEERRLTEDRFTVLLLRLLGHRWPKQIEAREPLPTWADRSGVIPLTSCIGETPLIERIRERMREDFPGGNTAALEREFEEIVGAQLEEWLAGPFFERHISQFKRRPIAWQIETTVQGPGSKGQGRGKKRGSQRNKPVFSCLVYHHKLDAGLLAKLRTHCVGVLRGGFETELRTLEGLSNPTADQQGRKLQLDGWIEEVKAFELRLEQVLLMGFGPEALRPALRQYATNDALLSLMACWLRRLEWGVRSADWGTSTPHPNPLPGRDGEGEKAVAAASILATWQKAADATRLHEGLAKWVDEAFSHLDYFCAAVGPKAPKESEFAVDPTSKDLAPLVCAGPAKTVERILELACERWWHRLEEVVLDPLKEDLKRKRAELERVKEELELDEVKRDYARQKNLADRKDELKEGIKRLREDIEEKTDKGKDLRSEIEFWTCPEAATWEDWLGTQPLFDEVASLDGKRKPPATIAEFVSQESAYAPDINDGVRVNIAPLQQAGLLHADVLDFKDAEKAIADRAEWRADERRWVREGKLPRPGWWGEGKDEG